MSHLQTFLEKNKEEIDSEEESDYETIEDDEEQFNFLDFLDMIENDKKIDYDNGNREIYFISMSKLFNGMDNDCINFSSLNRVINKERINTSFRNFSLHNSDAIIIAKIKEKNSFDILDGQHRLTYFNRNKEEFNGNEKIILDIRYLENEEEYCKLLNLINNRMNFTTGQLNKYMLLGIKEGLIEKLSNDMNKKNIYGRNRPRIQWDKIENILVNTNIYKNSDNKVEDIIDKLVMLNNDISRRKDIYEKYIGKRKKMMKRTFDFHLFLGIDPTYDIIKRIDTL